jgi:lipopolysaccharide export system protein LptA
MSKASLLSLAALLALGFSPVLRAEPPARPLTEAELLKTLDGLGKGDPVNKAPLSAAPALPKREPVKAPAVPEPRAPRAAATTPKPDLIGTATGATPKSETAKSETAKKEKETKEKTPMPGSTAGQTEITSEEAAFDQRTHQAIFTIKVFVRNPDFTLSCDKLTAYMKHDDDKPKKGGAPAAAEATPAPARLPTVEVPGVQVTGAPPKAAPGTGGPGGGLDKALAEGSVEIIQDKVSDDGTISHNVGHGKTAHYESADGSVTLRGKPDVQQGINTIEALDEETVIVLYRDGHMKTFGGRTKNIIREGGSATPAPKSTAGTTNGR